MSPVSVFRNPSGNLSRESCEATVPVTIPDNPEKTPLESLEKWLLETTHNLFETRGIDHIPSDQRVSPPLWNLATIWPSFLIHPGDLAAGLLGAHFGLSLPRALSAGIVGVALGALLPAYTSTLGPRLGLRQVVSSRFSFGYYGAKLIAGINIVAGGGYFVINTLVAGQTLSAVSGGGMSTAVGCVVVAVVAYGLSLFGYRVIVAVGRWFWVLAAVLFIILYAQAVPLLSNPGSSSSNLGSGNDISDTGGAWLSFMSLYFSAAGSCTYIAADYTCHYPPTTPLTSIALLTYLPITLSYIFTMSAGVILGQLAVFDAAHHPTLSAAYTTHGLGGLLATTYHPPPWSKTALVLLTLSIIFNNTGISYSTGLSIQVLGSVFLRVPRFIWSLLTVTVCALLAIIGREHLMTIIQNFVAMLGACATPFTLILLLEDGLFRAWTGYEPEDWNTPRRLPLGIAAVGTLLVAYFGGGFMGMEESWFVGPVARRAGGNVGIWMAGGVAILLYPGARWVERRYGR